MNFEQNKSASMLEKTPSDHLDVSDKMASEIIYGYNLIEQNEMVARIISLIKHHRNETAKELRIGNWVTHNNDWCQDEIKGPFKWEERHWYQVAECLLSLENVEPIPLTPEILEKAGFEDYYKEDRYKLKGYCYYDGCLWFGTSSIELEYLHQLQNLFFALTGEELEIKLS